MMLRQPFRSRTCRKIETTFLGILFLFLACFLYQVLTTDKIIVLSWFGIKVHNQPISERIRITSSSRHNDVNQKKSKPMGMSLNSSHTDGLFLSSYNTHMGKGDIGDYKFFIAIGCAITSRGIKLDSGNPGTYITFMRTLFPSFCKTNPPTWHMYSFYLSYDRDDIYFMKNENQETLKSKIVEFQDVLCPKNLQIRIKFVQCRHNGSPAWAQNDAMFEAYLDNNDYFYRINDDTSLSSNNWTEIMIESLKSNKPSNVGVVGPAHKGGNDAILVHDFVHRTHIEIFGFYYPRTFPDWWADDWISAVYGSERTKKLESVKAIHTGEKGTRYNHSWIPPAVLTNRLKLDRAVLDRYLSSKNKQLKPLRGSMPKGKAVISMSLYGDDPKYTYGAIRNAQLLPIIFPGWKLRIYIEKPAKNGHTSFPKVPSNIIRKLKYLGAEIVYVDIDIVSVPPMMWRFLVADDFSVDVFLVRDSDSRLIERDFEVVSEWLESDRPFHCVRDHPSHKSYPLFGGLIGGKPKDLLGIIGEKWQTLMKPFKGDYGLDLEFLKNCIWPRIKYESLCHDSISCRDWPNTWPFPTPRNEYEHVGQVFDAYGEARSIDSDLLKLYREPWECTLRGGESRQSWLLKQKANGKPLGNLRGVSKGRRQDRYQRYREEIGRQEAKIPYLTGKVVIWSMDYDVNYVRDMKDMLKDHGVTFIDKSLSSECSRVGTCPHNLTIITPENALNPGEDLIQGFYNKYKNDPEMAQVTHFLCTTPVALCEVYKAFNKRMIILATGRYEQDRLTPDKWRELNQFLIKVESSSKNIVGANNHYDVEYMRYFTGFDPKYLPNLAAFTETTYKHSRSEFLIAPIKDEKFRSWFIDALKKELTRANAEEEVVYIDDAYPTGYNQTNLASHPGIIVIPQKVSDIQYTEMYRMNIPLFMPSLELLARWQQKYNIIRNRTNNAERLRRHGISLKTSPVQPFAMGRFDPNDDVSGMSLRYWLRFADFLQLPHVRHFESMDQLVDQVMTTDLKITSIKMKVYNKRFKVDIISRWIDMLNTSLL